MRVLTAPCSLLLASILVGCVRAPRPFSLASDAQSSGGSVAEITEGLSPGIRRDVELLRAATARYHDLAAAAAAGYPTKLPRCVADSMMGGMGYHMVYRDLFDEKLEIERPEMLIYAPAADGGLQLAGVEYAVPFQFVPATARPPRLFGQDFRPYPQFNYWALHVWVWRRNSAGLFADWNPAITCPAATP